MGTSKAAALVFAATLLLGAGAPASAQEDPNAPCPGGANFTAADCPGGSCYAGAPNGCGSRSVQVIAAELVPDKWPAGVDFTAACNTHDTCYFTLGSNKDDCDQAFLDALLAECEQSLKCIDLPIVGERCSIDNPLYDLCAQLAQTYFEAVSSLGQESFDRDQADQAEHIEQCEAGAEP